jgi:hypothetical protein
MPRITVIFSLIYIALGLAGFFLTGAVHKTGGQHAASCGGSGSDGTTSSAAAEPDAGGAAARRHIPPLSTTKALRGGVPAVKSGQRVAGRA